MFMVRSYSSDKLIVNIASEVVVHRNLTVADAEDIYRGWGPRDWESCVGPPMQTRPLWSDFNYEYSVESLSDWKWNWRLLPRRICATWVVLVMVRPKTRIKRKKMWNKALSESTFSLIESGHRRRCIPPGTKAVTGKQGAEFILYGIRFCLPQTTCSQTRLN